MDSLTCIVASRSFWSSSAWLRIVNDLCKIPVSFQLRLMLELIQHQSLDLLVLEFSVFRAVSTGWGWTIAWVMIAIAFPSVDSSLPQVPR